MRLEVLVVRLNSEEKGQLDKEEGLPYIDVMPGGVGVGRECEGNAWEECEKESVER